MVAVVEVVLVLKMVVVVVCGSCVVAAGMRQNTCQSCFSQDDPSDLLQ